MTFSCCVGITRVAYSPPTTTLRRRWCQSTTWRFTFASCSRLTSCRWLLPLPPTWVPTTACTVACRLPRRRSKSYGSCRVALRCPRLAPCVICCGLTRWGTGRATTWTRRTCASGTPSPLRTMLTVAAPSSLAGRLSVTSSRPTTSSPLCGHTRCKRLATWSTTFTSQPRRRRHGPTCRRARWCRPSSPSSPRPTTAACTAICPRTWPFPTRRATTALSSWRRRSRPTCCPSLRTPSATPFPSLWRRWQRSWRV
mmetsp:Transcript_7281/g.23299  ORF Transcript_7281/g.23299 Transcript_7281/m.23299 type:complete len:254 (+) Transcript_7281:839-1600(+)